MDIKFYQNASKIYDFLRFPKLLYSQQKMEVNGEKKDEEFMKDYILFAHRISEKIGRYSDVIDEYYAEPIFRQYDIIDLLIVGIPIFEFKDIDSYFDYLLKLSREDLVNKTIETIILMSREEVEPEKLLHNKSNLFRFIDKLNINSNSKWRILGIIEDPVDFISKYISLMNSIREIFEEVYINFSFEVFDLGIKLRSFFEKKGLEGLESITGGLIRSEILDIDEFNIFISAMMPYNLSIMTASKRPYIIWGLKVEERFKRIKENQEDDLNSRLKVFEVIGNRTNYNILMYLLSGYGSSNEIAKELGLTGATVSYHVNGLLSNKLLEIDRRKKGYDYTINKKFILDSIDKLIEDLNLK